MIDYGHVGIPLYVVDARILCHQIVDYLEHEVLHLRIREVKHKLGPATAFYRFTLRSLYHPIWMSLVKLADRVGHFRLNPYSEADSMSIGTLHQPAYAVRKLVLVHLPVAEGAVVGQTGIFLTEPAVVHDEELSSHIGYVLHHLVHSRLVDVEIHTLPAVEQDLAELPAVGQLVVAAPPVEVAAGTAQTFVRICQGKFRSLEDLLGSECIFRIVGVDSGIELMPVGVAGVNAEFVVSAVAEGCSDHAAGVLLRLAVKREHDLGVVCVGISYSVLVLDSEHSALERLLGETAFVGPCAVEMADPDITYADRKVARIETGQLHRFLLQVLDLGPCLYHIHILVCTVADCDIERIHGVLQADSCHLGGRFLFCPDSLDLQHCGQVSVCVGHSQSRFRCTPEAVWRIGIMIRCTGCLKVSDIRIAESVSEIHDLEFLARFCVKDQFSVRCRHAHLCHGQGCDHQRHQR